MRLILIWPGVAPPHVQLKKNEKPISETCTTQAAPSPTRKKFLTIFDNCCIIARCLQNLIGDTTCERNTQSGLLLEKAYFLTCGCN